MSDLIYKLPKGSSIFILLGVHLIISPAAEGLKCYVCPDTSKPESTQGNCTLESYGSLMECNKNIKEPVCSTMKMTRYKGIVGRGCMDKAKVYKDLKCGEMKTYHDGIEVDLCVCEGEGCNGPSNAMMISITKGNIFAGVLLTFLFAFFYF